MMNVNIKNNSSIYLLLFTFFAALSAVYIVTSCTNTTSIQHYPNQATSDDFVLLFTGNWAGHLEPCGCTDVQLGGIDRRTQTIQKLAPDPCASLLLDAGPLIDQQDRQSQLKFETFLYSLRQLNYDAVSLTPPEIVLLRENLALTPDQYSPVICSNLSPDLMEKYSIKPFLRKTLNHGEFRLNCLIFSLWDPRQIAEPQLADKFSVREPVAALKELLTAQNLSPDQPTTDTLIIVMLSTLNNDNLTQELLRIPALNILVTRGTAEEPELCPHGKNSYGTLELTTGKMGKYITRVSVPFRKSPHDAHLNFDSVAIDSAFPRDPAIVSFIDDYQSYLKLENLIEDEFAIPRLPLSQGDRFLGSFVCAGCHLEIYETWKKSNHSHAMDTLERVKRNFDPECVACHTVGMKYEGGYRSMEKTAHLAGVGCEMCHGPGGRHLDNPLGDYRQIFTSCEQCHDHENSPAFDANREEYIRKIRHW